MPPATLHTLPVSLALHEPHQLHTCLRVFFIGVNKEFVARLELIGSSVFYSVFIISKRFNCRLSHHQESSNAKYLNVALKVAQQQ